MTRHTLILLSLLLPLACTDSSDPIQGEIAAIEQGLTRSYIRSTEAMKKYTIQERMEYYHIPGLSIAVIIDGELRWAKGYGVANSSARTEVDANTLFQAASISKPLSALGVLKLVEAHKIHLDSNVNNYLSSWKLEENELTGDQVPSLRLILSHNGGISVHGFEGYKQTEAIPTLEQVLNGEGNSAKIRVAARPGEHAIYSGGGYTVIQKMLEDLTGQPFQEYMDQAVLSPLGMNHSTFAQPLPKAYHARASAAYDKQGELIDGLWHNYPEQAAAGLWTTPTDLSKYLIEIMEIYHGKEDGILSRGMVNDMLSLQGGGYHGMGPEVTDSDGTLEFGHLGKNAGFTNDMLGGAATKNAIIIMTNADNGGSIMPEIQRSVCGYYGINLEIPSTQVVETTKVSSHHLDSLTGRYEFVVVETGERLGQYMDLSVEDGTLTALHVSAESKHTLEPLIEDQFLDFGSRLLIKFNQYDSLDGFEIEDWGAQLVKVDR